MNAELKFLRRLGEKAACYYTYACPDILELEGGDFAVIGADITADAVGKLPPSVGCGPNERIVRIPRSILIAAKRDIPDTL